MGDVGPYAQPIRKNTTDIRSRVISNPGLQVSRCGYRLRCGEPQKIPAAHEHFGAEEIVTWGQSDRRIKGDSDQDLFSRYRTFTAGELVGNASNAVHHRVRCR